MSIIFNKTTGDAVYLNGLVDGKEGKDKDDGWAELCVEMGWDRWHQPILQNRYDDGWYEGAIAAQKKAA